MAATCCCSTSFNFKGVDQGKRVGELSGGERGRLHLAKLLQVGGNMLLLDEPTNDLDLETLRALENALLEVDQGKRVGELSGGERGRLHLAKLLQVGGNMLLLDEPTNDLDLETLRALENALLEFPGCAMDISHDRWFLDRIATHILDYQDEGKVEFF